MEITTTPTRPRRLLRTARTAPLGAAIGALITIGISAVVTDHQSSERRAPIVPAAGHNLTADASKHRLTFQLGSAAVWTGDAKDHPGYGPIASSGAVWTGDAKDHPGYGPIASSGAVWTGDAKDHPGYGPIASSGAVWTGDAKDHPGYGTTQTTLSSFDS